MLPEPGESLWQAYLAAEKRQVRQPTLRALAAFLAELERAPPTIRREWARDVARRVVDEKEELPVRMPLFRAELFPVLREGLERREPGCARWLAGFAPYLSQSRECQSRLPATAQTDDGLLRQAIEHDPDDRRAKASLLLVLRRRFDFALHELPGGVLYGMNGATPEQCDRMEDELNFYEALAIECSAVEERPLIDEARFYVRAYAEFQRTCGDGASFEEFLAERGR